MKKIAIVNRTCFKNYGSVLQCFALCEAIKALGYDSEIVWESGGLLENYDLRVQKIIGSVAMIIHHPSLIQVVRRSVRSIKTNPITKETSRLFDSFVRENIDQTLYKPGELKKISRKRYDKFVCGSDQIWNPNTLYLDPLLFLRFSPRNKRVAYAPSLGCESIPAYNRKKMKRYVEDIPFISVREKKGQDLLKELCGKEYFVACDPTLLMKKDFWKEYAKEPGIRNYILCYFLDIPSEKVQKEISELSLKQKKTLVVLNSELSSLDEAVAYIKPDCGPSEFLGYVQNSDLVITDSYHGMLFSILFEKEFLSVERNYKEHNQSSRQLTVLEKLGLEGKYGKCINEDMLFPIDYGNVNDKLEYERNASLNYLKTALEG